jgi:hypothetical protein
MSSQKHGQAVTHSSKFAAVLKFGRLQRKHRTIRNCPAQFGEEWIYSPMVWSHLQQTLLDCHNSRLNWSQSTRLQLEVTAWLSNWDQCLALHKFRDWPIWIKSLSEMSSQKHGQAVTHSSKFAAVLKFGRLQRKHRTIRTRLDPHNNRLHLSQSSGYSKGYCMNELNGNHRLAQRLVLAQGLANMV